MKKSSYRYVRLVSVLTLALLTLGACGDKDSPSTPAGGSSDGTASFSTLEDGILKVGSCLDYKPFEFVKDGDEMGFDVELTEELAKRLGLEVKWITANFDTIFTSVASGQFDMVAAASTINEERLAVVDFSDPYFNSRQGLTVNTDATPDIQTIDDIKEGDVVGVQKGTTGKDYAEAQLGSKGVEVKTFDAAPDAFTDLEAGNVVAVVNDEGSSIAEAESRPGLEVVQAIDTEEKYGLAFSKDNPELTDAINGALKEVIADGTYETIFKKWFPDLPVPPEYKAS
jgi:ABC-type amino acid transport substrate-binding protein